MAESTRPNTPAGTRRPRRRAVTRNGVVLAAFVVPAFLLFGVFIVWPLIQGVQFSLFNWSGTGPLTNFVGFGNYVRALIDPHFSPQVWSAIGHNFYFFAISAGLTLVVGIGLAYTLMIVSERASQRYTLIFLLPFTLPPVAIAYIWGIYLQPNTGIFSSILTALHLQALDVPTLGSTVLALPTLAVLTAWIGMGFPVLVLLASFTEVPQEMMDAASIDGAGRFRILWSILIPAVRPTILLVMNLNFIGAFGIFDLIYVLEGTQAGPAGATDVISTLFYRTAFGGFGATAQSMGLATAIAVIGFVIVVACSAIFLRLQKRFAQ